MTLASKRYDFRDHVVIDFEIEGPTGTLLQSAIAHFGLSESEDYDGLPIIDTRLLSVEIGELTFRRAEVERMFGIAAICRAEFWESGQLTDEVLNILGGAE